jgi:hypothetical protein
MKNFMPRILKVVEIIIGPKSKVFETIQRGPNISPIRDSIMVVIVQNSIRPLLMFRVSHSFFSVEKKPVLVYGRFSSTEENQISI